MNGYTVIDVDNAVLFGAKKHWATKPGREMEEPWMFVRERSQSE